MNYRVLPTVEERIRKYQGEHQGEMPLYIVMAEDEANDLMTEVKSSKGYDENIVVTELNGSKIIKHDALKAGDIRLTNDLPETGS